MKKFLGLILITIFTFSCGDGFDAKVEEGKILDVHDEVMPKLGEVMSLKRKVLAKATEIEADSPGAESLKDLRDLAGDLDGARDGMMKWMNDWAKSKEPHMSGTSSKEDQIAFFAAEMERITKVKEAINSSIAAAKEILK